MRLEDVRSAADGAVTITTPSASTEPSSEEVTSSDSDRSVEVHVLDRVEQFDALGGRTLEGLAA